MKAVIFDLYETLVTEFSDRKRISNRHYDYMALLGLAYPAFKKSWSARQGRRMSGELSSYHEVLHDILAEHGLPIKPESIEYLYQERIKEKRIPFQDIRPDIIDMLHTLGQHQVKLGLISNCTEEEVRYWGESPLAKCFDTVIFSYETGMAKPDQRIYELASERMGIRTDEAFFVGDGGSQELTGAEHAGMTPCHATWFNGQIASPYPIYDSPRSLVDEILKHVSR